MPPRAAIQARDGTIIAQGEQRLSDLGSLASEIAGRLGPAPPEREEELARRGVPEGTPVGLTGLERTFDERLAGKPGGTLKAGGARAGAQRAGRGLGRADHDRPRDPGGRRDRAGRAASAGSRSCARATARCSRWPGSPTARPQPPGSTFKIVTLAGLLDAGVVKRNAKFPVETKTTLEGVELENANGEACGGSLRASFAESCNSVFAPLGAKLGAERLVATAEKFGFNEEPGLPGAARSTIPAADEVGDDLAVGSTAIGQGKVLATPLLMADVASAIAQDGRRPKPTLLKGAGGVAGRATTPETARFIARAMRSVVTDGTGIGAAVPGVKVAGKTGTAELRSTVSEDPIPDDPSQPPPEEDLTDTDAWFTAFAPLQGPAGRGLRAARRSGRRRRHRGPGRQDRHRSRPEELKLRLGREARSHRAADSDRAVNCQAQPDNRPLEARGPKPTSVPAVKRTARSAAQRQPLRRRGRRRRSVPDPRLKRNSSGRFWSDSVLTLNSSSEPWIVPSEATESASGIRPLGGIGSGL